MTRHMPATTLSIATVQRLAEFVALYLGKSPTPSEIRDYTQLKLEEKDIFKCYEHELITEDEVCYFITDHVYMKFVRGEAEILDVDEETVSAFHRRLKQVLFGS